MNICTSMNAHDSKRTGRAYPLLAMQHEIAQKITLTKGCIEYVLLSNAIWLCSKRFGEARSLKSGSPAAFQVVGY